MQRPACLVVALIGLAVMATPAVAKKPWPLCTDQVRAHYSPPKDPKHQTIDAALRERRVLERLRELLSPLRLPRILTVKVESCEGIANAFYEDHTVTICYEYLDFVVQSAPKETTPGGLFPGDALIGPTVDVFLQPTAGAVPARS
jgi:hypothetical protein